MDAQLCRRAASAMQSPYWKVEALSETQEFAKFYKEWMSSLEKAPSFEDLPPELQTFIERCELSNQFKQRMNEEDPHKVVEKVDKAIMGRPVSFIRSAPQNADFEISFG